MTIRKSVVLPFLLACFAASSWGQFVLDRPTSIVAGSGRFLYILSEGNILRTEDSGAHWIPTTIGVAAGTAFKSLVSDPTDPQRVWTAADQEDGGVFRSTDAGVTWTQVNSGLPQTGDARGFFTARGQSNLVYVRIGNQVYKTANGGDSWSLKSTLPDGPNVRTPTFTINVTDPTVWYYVTASTTSSQFVGVYRSRDEGATWQPGGIIQITNVPGVFNAVQSIASSPVDPNTIWIAQVGGLRGSSLYGLFTSSDGGVTIEHPYDYLATRVWIDLLGNVFYLNSTSGVNAEYFRSTNNGGTFQQRFIKPDSHFSNTFFFDLAQPGVMYTATVGGPYRSTDAGLTWTYLNGEIKGTLETRSSVDVSVPQGDYTVDADVPLKFAENPEWEGPFTASLDAAGWAQLSATSGTIPSTLNVTVKTTGLAQGSYQTKLTIQCETVCANSPLEIPVHLDITDPNAQSGPQYDVTTIAGGPTVTHETGLATDTFIYPYDVTVDREGRVLVSDTNLLKVRRINLDGTIESVAGNGVDGTATTGGLAVNLPMDPAHILADPEGGFWIRDASDFNLRHVDAQGRLTLVPGQRFMDDMDIGPDGNLYVLNARIYRVARNGTKTEMPVNGFSLNNAVGFAAGPNGEFYFSDRNTNAVYRVAPGGAVDRYAGTGTSEGLDIDGIPATLALIHDYPRTLAVDAQGNLFFGDAGGSYAIRMVDTNGIIHTLSGPGNPPAQGPAIRFPYGITVDDDGNVYVADRSNRLVRKLSPKRPTILSGGVVNAASGAATFSPGSLLSVFGDFEGVTVATPAAFPWPTSMSGVRITLNGRDMPLSYVGAGQLNAQIPYETAQGAATLIVSVNGNASLPVTINIGPASPGILQFGANRALAVNLAGTDNPYEINTDTTPVDPGGYVVVYMIGMGAPSSAVPTGEVAPDSPLIQPVASPVTVMIGDRSVPFDFLGLSPGWVGLVQLNLPIPGDLPDGDYPVKVTIGGVASNTAIISIRR